MKTLTKATLAAVLGATTLASPAFAQQERPGRTAGAQPVNELCPISKQQIDGRTFTDHAGSRVGFCCGGCVPAFNAWDDQRRDRFVEAALAGKDGRRDTDERQHGDPPPDEPTLSTAYALDTCPVSGMELGSMGEPVVKRYNGREVRFCCDGCIDAFEDDPESHWREIDKRIVESQLPFYPLNECPVAGMELGSMGEPVNHVYNNRLVRFCCAGCLGAFESDPARYLKKIDEAAKKDQRESYPLETCLVAGAPLGSMGEPHEVIVAGRLVRLCCAGCLPALEREPWKFVQTIDNAWREKNPERFRE